MLQPALVQRRRIGNALGTIEAVRGLEQLHRFKLDTLGQLQGCSQHDIEVRALKIVSKHLREALHQ
ncbi:hypothetical protein D9M71_450080 [compost metagenome]